MFLFGTLLSANAQVPSYVPSDGLVGWWPVSGNANDQSGNANNGTVNGATLTTDRFGVSDKAYNFNGTSNSISVPANIKFTQNPITYSFWFNKVGPGRLCPGTSSESFQTIFSTGSYTQSRDISISTDNRLGVGRSIPSGCDNSMMIQTNLAINKWNHIVLIYESNLVKIYMNGIHLGNYPFTCSVTTVNNTSYIGASNPATWACVGYFKGNLDDIGIWNRILDTNEIKLLYTGCNKKITLQPISIITSGKIASFTCQANDTLQTFQWQVLNNGNWINLKDSGGFSGTQTSQLTINQLLSKNNGQKFRCIVKGNCINAVSQEVALTYNCNGIITSQPTNQEMFSGNAIYTCATNDTLVNYQWQSDIGMGWNNLSNAGQYIGTTTNSLQVSSVTSSNNNQKFRCVIKGDCSTDTTNEATLKVWGLGIEDEFVSRLNAYPNPSSTQVIIDNGNFSTMGSYSAKILNASGQQVFQSVINQQQFVIDANTMGGAGVYTLYITDGNNKVVGVKKIVLQ